MTDTAPTQDEISDVINASEAFEHAIRIALDEARRPMPFGEAVMLGQVMALLRVAIERTVASNLAYNEVKPAEMADYIEKHLDVPRMRKLMVRMLRDCWKDKFSDR